VLVVFGENKGKPFTGGNQKYYSNAIGGVVTTLKRTHRLLHPSLTGADVPPVYYLFAIGPNGKMESVTNVPMDAEEADVLRNTEQFLYTSWRKQQSLQRLRRIPLEGRSRPAGAGTDSSGAKAEKGAGKRPIPPSAVKRGQCTKLFGMVVKDTSWLHKIEKGSTGASMRDVSVHTDLSLHIFHAQYVHYLKYPLLFAGLPEIGR
jgi:hypothetical protein